MIDIKEVAQTISKEYNLEIDFLWNNADVVELIGATHHQLDLMKSIPFFAEKNSLMIKVDLDIDPIDVGSPKGVCHLNVLCHELGHIISSLKRPQFVSDLDLEYVTKYEAETNTPWR